MGKDQKLRIATMVTGHFTVPLPLEVVYAPLDVASWINGGLQRRGHEVDFYAPEGSIMNVRKVISHGLRPLKKEGKENDHPILEGGDVGSIEEHKIFNLWDQYLISHMFKAAEKGEYDLLHIHPVDRALPLGLSHPKVPVVYTLHDPIFPWRAEVSRMFTTENQHYVSISDAQRKPAPDLNYATTVYNGIDISLFPFSRETEDYFLFVGRLHPEKGVAEAVEAARKAGEKLVIVGPPVTGKYWDNRIAPYIDGEQIKYIGHVPRHELYKYYQKARATLVPIQWEEPFGLVMPESMATGTPVIAFRRGSVPEIVVEGKTGFIVDTVDEMVVAMKKVDDIKREDCRAHAEKNFSIENMVDGYEKAFLKITGKL